MAEVLLMLFAALNLADFILTRKILDAGGRELNPIVNALMKKIGVVPALVVMKAGAVAIVILVYVEYGFDWWWIAAIDVGYALVVANNWKESKK